MQCAGVQAVTVQGGSGGILPRVSEQQDPIHNGLKLEVQLLANSGLTCGACACGPLYAHISVRKCITIAQR